MLETRFILAIGLLMIPMLAWITLNAVETKQHLLGEACETCHLSSRVTSAEARKLRASEEKLCAGCHPSALAMSHPSGFTPTRQMPGEFPLDWKGDLTCSTCHRIHGDVTTLNRTRSSGKTLCLRCHNDDFFRRMRDDGMSLIRSGHLDARGNVPSGVLDNYSVQCLGCHEDELSSAGLQVTVSTAGVARHGSGTANHPIGVNYSATASYGSYRSQATISPAIVLPEGKVACISCHEGYSSTHGRTVVTARGLCLECHDL